MVATELLRFLIVVAFLLTLAQPEWRLDARPRDKPILVVLEDRSASMSTEDMGDDAASASRREVVETLEQSGLWEALGDSAVDDLDGVDFVELKARAEAQRTELEQLRRRAAAEAFAAR